MKEPPRSVDIVQDDYYVGTDADDYSGLILVIVITTTKMMTMKSMNEPRQ